MTSLVYLDGTASVSTGSALVTGHGTAWKIALVEGGSFSLAGLSVPILSVDSDTSLTLAYDWPGNTLEEARYAIARETSQAIRAAWINDRLAQFHQKPWGIGVLPDGRGTLAERNALNPMPFDNYCWLRVEVDQPAELYFKVPSGWLGPFRLSGEVGPVGPAGVLRWRTEGWNNTASYQVNDGLAHNGTSYRAYVAHEASPATQPGVGANWQSVWQVTAQGTILIEGTTTTLPPDQPARVEFEPALGGYAVNFFVPRGPTGDIDGIEPYWVNLLSTAADAEAALAGLGAAGYQNPQALTPAQKGQVVANIGAGILAGFRNKIINYDFDVWQRGATLAAATGSRYGADRCLSVGIGSSSGQERKAFPLGQTAVPGNPKYYNSVVAHSVAGAGNASNVQQRIEGVRTFAGRKVTLTLYARSVSLAKFSASFVQAFGTGGSAAVSIPGRKFDVGAEWSRYDVVIDIPSIAGKILGPNGDDALYVQIWLDAGSNYDALTDSLGHQTGQLDIAHMSLVEGDATAEDDPCAPRHIQQERSLCRWYYRETAFRTTMNAGGAGEFFTLNLDPDGMRTSPTLSTKGALELINAGNFVAASAIQVTWQSLAAGAVVAGGIVTQNAEL